MKRRHFLYYSLLFVTSCGVAQQTGSLESGESRETGKEPKKLRFAVTDVLDSEKLQRDYGEFRTALAEVLEVEVEFVPVSNMLAAVSALTLDQLDIALAGPSEYVVIHARTQAVPLIAVTRPNYRSAIAVPKDSPIQSTADLKGKVLALSDVGSTSGHLGPTKLLIDAGLDPKVDVEIRMLGDEGSVAALKEGTADAWGGSIVDYEKFIKTDDGQFPIVAQGPMLPSDVLIASSQLDPAFVDAMRSRLVENQTKLIGALVLGESTKKYKGSKLVPANDADYDMVRQVYQALGEGDLIPQQSLK